MSRKVAFGGIQTALCVALVYLAAYLPTGKLGIYALSSVVIAIAVVELGIKFATVVYSASAILIFLLTGNINALIIFVLFFGSYPFVKYFIEMQRSAVREMLLKFGALNLQGILYLYAYKALLGVMPINISTYPLWAVLGFVIAAQAVFLVYDYILSRLIDYYMNRIRKAVKR